MNNINKFEYVSSADKTVDLPSRSTEYSAGYDFHSPIDFKLKPHHTICIKLGIKCQIKNNECLLIIPRSSLGFKNKNYTVLTNTIGVIDSDYYNNDSNEGEICLKLHNFSHTSLIIKKNDKLVQGIFMRYDTADDDNSCKTKRKGGLGSTGN
jgi:dUTP pyrophosphatase